MMSADVFNARRNLNDPERVVSDSEVVIDFYSSSKRAIVRMNIRLTEVRFWIINVVANLFNR